MIKFYNYLGRGYMDHMFGEYESSCRRGQCGGASLENDSLQKANAALDDALVNLDKKIIEIEDQKRKLMVQGGMDDAVKALQGQVDLMKDQKTTALSARDLSKNTVGTKSTADQALTDLSLSLNKVVNVTRGACRDTSDCTGTGMVCSSEGLCKPGAWYEVEYWGMPLWGWLLLGLVFLIIAGVAIYFAIPYIETAVNGMDGFPGFGSGGSDMGTGAGAAPMSDVGSMAGATPGYPGSA